MNKSEIVEAINSTIVSNGQKGISAESLNLILNEMINVTEDVVEEEKPNVGDGALRILVPDDMAFSSIFFDTTAYLGSDIPEGFTPGLFSQSNYEIIKQFMLNEINSGAESGDEFFAMMYQMYVDFFNTLDIKIPEMFAHNAEVYNILMDKLENGEGAYLLIDQSLLATEFLKMQLNLMGLDAGMGDIGTDARMSISQPAMFSGMKAFIFQEELGSESVIMFSSMHSPTASLLFPTVPDSPYNAGNMFMLLPDGSITNQDMTIGNYIYVPKSDGVLTDQQKYYNSNVSLNPTAQNQLKYIRLIDSEGETEDYSDSYNVGPRILQASENTFTYLEELDYKKAQIDGDGNVTVTILGSLVASGSTTETTN